MEKEQALAHNSDIEVEVDMNILVLDDDISEDIQEQDDSDDNVYHGACFVKQ